MTVSRLAERLKELLNTRGLTQAEVVRRSEGIGKYVSKGTVSTYLSNPPTRPKRQVIEAFAEILDVPVSDLEDAAAFTGREPFTPDPSSDRLTAPQRAAVNEVIRQLAEANTRAGDGSGNATPTKQAAGSAVTKGDYGLIAYDLGSETMAQRQDRKADSAGSESQDPEDWK